ncbi:hypothetical protein [Deinococcus hopiensis]|uniref:Uncharacterized protein n=1 Tax=Deinococcus hopiensis KR-140 TaxID=695939 RepID=A0A1W1UJF2_9DEIO|nr:hypothetical protein [Deinococcus hopiensis]SMB81172.1 hypothetical protein SAMN00790413_04489 [Deinococcus hopiensis KR-140]
MTPPAGSDLVKAILEARRKAGTVILSASPAPITPQRTPEGIPTLPKLVPPPTPPPPAPLDDVALAALLTRLLPQVLGGIDQVKAALGDRKLSFPEALSLATTVAGVVSLAVRDGAPLVKGKSADALVVLIFGVVFAGTPCRRCPSGSSRSPQRSRLAPWLDWMPCTGRSSRSGKVQQKVCC